MSLKSMRKICEYKGVDIVLLVNPGELLKDSPAERRRILLECEAVQRSVWSPKESIEENTINNDLLLLMEDNGKVVGFTSVKLIDDRDNKFAYWHDAMIVKKYQGMGFSRLLSLLLLGAVSTRFSAPYFNLITITSNSRVLKTLYTKDTIFKNLSFPVPSSDQVELFRSFSSHLAIDDKIDVDTGIVRQMWLPQEDNDQHITNVQNLNILLNEKLSSESGDALAVVTEIDEESVVNADLYVREMLKVDPGR